MRLRYFVVLASATIWLALSPPAAEAQRRHSHGRGPAIVRSPLLFGGYYAPYFLGYNQWYPYPAFGFPPMPGFYPGDPSVTVRLQVVPREAIVYVDGYAAGEVDDFDGVFQRLRLAPGHHEIAVFQQGYRTLRQALYFNPGSTNTIRHTLVPLGPGELQESQPAPRDPPSQARRTGTLALRVQPLDASVYIDDEPWRGPQGQERLVVQLGEGTHRVRVEKPGFQMFSVDVEVRAGETASFNVSLVP